MIPFRIKKLTKTAKVPHRNDKGDLWDLFADSFSILELKDFEEDDKDSGACASKTSLQEIGNDQLILQMQNDETHYVEELNMFNIFAYEKCDYDNNPDYIAGFTICPGGRILVKTGIAIDLPVQLNYGWNYRSDDNYLGEGSHAIINYAVADIRPRSGLALKYGITVLNTPGTIDNSYRKEIGVILYNAGHDRYTITKGDKIAQMLIRPLATSEMEVVDNITDTNRGGYGSTGK